MWSGEEWGLFRAHGNKPEPIKANWNPQRQVGTPIFLLLPLIWLMRATSRTWCSVLQSYPCLCSRLRDARGGDLVGPEELWAGCHPHQRWEPVGQLRSLEASACSTGPLGPSEHNNCFQILQTLPVTSANTELCREGNSGKDSFSVARLVQYKTSTHPDLLWSVC